MNFEQARQNMIKQQLRPCEVVDPRILGLIEDIHREDFIPEQYVHLALCDTRIPLLHGQCTMTPMVEGRIIQNLDIQDHEKILEIGTGCGYLTALLAKSGKNVHSVDIFPDFIEQATPKFRKYGLDNIHLHKGDAVKGWPEQGPYDVIVVTGSVPVLETFFQQQLTVNGRLFVIVGSPPAMEARLITRKNNDEWISTCLFETEIPPLVGAPQPEAFHF